MLDKAMPLPEDPQDLRALARLPIAEVKAQAVLVERLAAPAGGPSGAPVRFLRRERQAALAGAGDERGGSRGHHGPPALARERRGGRARPAAAPPPPRPHPAHARRDPSRRGRLRPLRRPPATFGREHHRGAGARPRPLCREPHHPSAPGVLGLRALCAGAAAFAPHRARAAPDRGCWLTCWSQSTATTCRFAARARCSGARGSTSSARRWPTGSGAQRLCSSPWRMQLAGTCWRARRSSACDTPLGMLAPGTGRTAAARLWACVRDGRPWGGPGAALGRPGPARGVAPLLP